MKTTLLTNFKTTKMKRESFTNTIKNQFNMRKNTILTLALAFVGAFAMAQEMTIAHTGITTVPVSTDKSLTVTVGETITFKYGGGQTHPMTESHPNTGAASAPIPFVTQTVSSSIPTTTFQLNTVGTYVFHCGNNTGSDKNYGTIYVTEGTTSIDEVVNNPISIFPNPATNNITIEGLTDIAQLLDVNGKKVMDLTNGTFDISDLSTGSYIVKSEKYNTLFIKK